MTLLGGSGPSKSLTALATVLLVVPLVALGVAAQSPVIATVVAGEVICEETTFCWDMPITGVNANTTLNLTVDNPAENTAHSFYVDLDGDFDENHGDSAADAAEARTATLRPGESAQVEFTVPEGTERVYIWCEEPGHEQEGMWSFVEVGAPEPPAEGEGGLVAQQVGVPLFSYWVGVIAIFAMLGWLAITFFVLRYQSTHHTDHRDRKRK